MCFPTAASTTSVIQCGPDRGVGQVLGCGPTGLAPRCLLQRHQGGTEAAATEEKVARGRNLWSDGQAPMEIVIKRIDPEEGASVHQGGPDTATSGDTRSSFPKASSRLGGRGSEITQPRQRRRRDLKKLSPGIPPL